MSQFNIGDIVRIINKQSWHYGERGIIIFNGERTITVDFPDGAVTYDKTWVELVEKARFKYGDYVQITDTYHPLYGQYGFIRRHYLNGNWRIQIDYTYIQVKDSEIKPLSKENNADIFTKIKIDEIKGTSISKQEEKKTMKSEEFVKDIFNRLNKYITLKQGEILNAIQSEDKNWQEAQMHMNKLQELHDLYYPDQIIPLPSSSGYFCSPDTTIMERKVNGKSKYLKEELLKKQELITHALQVDENMSSEAVFKLLHSYGLTDECGKVLPVTGKLICNLLELPEDETLF